MFKRRKTQSSDKQLGEIAQGNIERHIGDVCKDANNDDSVSYDEAYTLAFDALRDKGVKDDKARRIAEAIATKFAQP